MEAYSVLRDLCIIIVFGKAFGILARKLRAPQVVGEIVAGLVIGPCVLGIVQQTDFLSVMAEIGVILLMFSAGLETSIQDLKRTGVIAFLIACAGVLVPLIGGTLLYEVFYGFSPWGSENFLKAMMIGCIMTATSVSITVRALQELGHLKGIVGTTIMSAAIIDDVIGIIVLTVVLGFKDPSANIGRTCLMTALFFVLALVLGYVIFRIFKAFDDRYLHTRRVPILGLALCMFMAYVAEEYFGVADITGAYLAGIILSSLKDANYIAEKMDINSYMLFGPVFFASIGLKTDITGLTP
ncbi:MAG TPA: cation:proton antiporter, partial [Candidatus Faecivivens stercoripullorum]|nr:cation:proton antiporter [Candidatus Faecivivens stercoripullorum]